MSSDTATVRWLVLDVAKHGASAVWTAILDAEERRRATRFVHAADRAAFIAAHVLLRTMLFQAAGLPPAAWRFVTGPHGKPALHPDHGLPGLDFNLSYTRGTVACGITQGGSIGVDIEHTPGSADRLAMAEAFFAPSEVAWLRTLGEEERPDAFVRLWTLKEAYIKARGLGLSLALDRFAFTLDPIAITFAGAQADDPAQWQFASLDCITGHQLAVARRSGRRAPIDVAPVTRDEIMGLI
jgi:4'-phosphopantetheinyl transferase